MLILGGSATVNSLTGMNTLAVRRVSFFSHQGLIDGNRTGMFPDPARSSHLCSSRRHASNAPMRLVSLS